MEQAYLFKATTNKKLKCHLQLMIVFPQNVEESSYIIQGELFIESKNKSYEGFTICVDVLKSTNKQKKVEMDFPMMKNIYKTIANNQIIQSKNKIILSVTKQTDFSFQSLPEEKNKKEVEIVEIHSENIEIKSQKKFTKVKTQIDNSKIQFNIKLNLVLVEKRNNQIKKNHLKIFRCSVEII